MSSLELNKGVAYKASQQQIAGKDIDDLMDAGFVQIGDDWYEIDYEIEAETDEFYIEQAVVTDSGAIHFTTVHYNGCEGLGEVLERAVKNCTAGENNLKAACRDADRYDGKYFTDSRTGKIWLCEGVLIREDDLYYSMVETCGGRDRLHLSFVGSLESGHGFIPVEE